MKNRDTQKSNAGRSVKNGGMGLISTLTLLFVVLKLTGNISWPWLWVFCPVWISGLLILTLFSVVLIAGRIKKGRW